jgi:hypothetical protein
MNFLKIKRIISILLLSLFPSIIKRRSKSLLTSYVIILLLQKVLTYKKIFLK